MMPAAVSFSPIPCDSRCAPPSWNQPGQRSPADRKVLDRPKRRCLRNTSASIASQPRQPGRIGITPVGPGTLPRSESSRSARAHSLAESTGCRMTPDGVNLTSTPVITSWCKGFHPHRVRFQRDPKQSEKIRLPLRRITRDYSSCVCTFRSHSLESRTERDDETQTKASGTS
jgi:hypothetical protein